MARFSITKMRGYFEIECPYTSVTGDETDMHELRDLLLREFPAGVDRECSADFRSADGKPWNCELPHGHNGLHAAPGVNEIEHKPAPETSEPDPDEVRLALDKVYVADVHIAAIIEAASAWLRSREQSAGMAQLAACDPARRERRERIATHLLPAVAGYSLKAHTEADLISESIRMADALIAELDKEV